MEQYVVYLQSMIDRNREDLSILLRNRYGIDEPPTPQLLLALYKLHGKEFLYDLSIATNKPDDLVHIEGYEDEPWLGGDTTTTTKEKANVFDSLVKVFDFGVKAASTVKSNNKTTTAPAPNAAGSTTRKMIVIGAIVLVVLITIAIVIRKKS